MKKKIIVVTMMTKVLIYYRELLSNILGDFVEFEGYALEDDKITHTLKADLIVIALSRQYDEIKEHIDSNAKVVIINNTITREQFNRLMEIPEGEKVMLVNYTLETTLATMTLFKQIGINHLEFKPYYPDASEIPDTRIAVTTGESQLVPDSVETVIDIGPRVLDTSTLVDIIVKVGCEHLMKDKKFIENIEKLKTFSSGIETLLTKSNSLESQLWSLLDILDDGIIAVNSDYQIIAINKLAENILNYKGLNLVGMDIRMIIRELDFSRLIEEGKEIGDRLVKLDDINTYFKAVPTFVARKNTGAIIIINKYNDKERIHQKIRGQIYGKGQKAKYSFSDIIGSSDEMVRVIGIAKKMSKSDASVLILGESGTGKEMFAQAIHNNSMRKNNPFVAINCAALPANLLESELFGYEEGAFTGALKGGKPGLFEIAHQGSLFLDEIGEMPMDLQAKILRVLQEREVMRLGGKDVINVDIRVIAATNKNLKSMIKEKKFRQDLYYRLKVLPLHLVPLRKRAQDVLLLVEEFKRDIGAGFVLNQESRKILLEHTWEGNIRELRNCVEYLQYLNKAIIEPEDLEGVIEDVDSDIDDGFSVSNDIYDLLEDMDINREDLHFVLKTLKKGHEDKQRMGRRSIAGVARDENYNLTEGEIRRILKEMEIHKLISVHESKRGTKITDFGLKLLRKL